MGPANTNENPDAPRRPRWFDKDPDLGIAAFMALAEIGLLISGAVIAGYSRPGTVELLAVYLTFLVAGAALCLYLLLSRRGKALVARQVALGPEDEDRDWDPIMVGYLALAMLAIPVFAPIFPLLASLGSYFKRGKAIRVLFFVWIAANVVLATRLEAYRRETLGFTLAVGCAVASFFAVLLMLRKRGGIPLLYTVAEDSITPTTVFGWALLLIGAFGCIHLHLAHLDPNAYHGIVTWLDSLYFSLVTFATVGYGDIYPLTPPARWATMIEIVSGLLMLVIAINATITVWLQRSNSNSNT